ncbi:MAG: Bro-N domain-containing protein [Selenomonadaceae bacterium]|nr:Bro-N domain-containing protein [Selenomonadaceae bacterium]
MNALQIFQHEKFGKIRAIMIDGKAWFVGKDAAAMLGYKNTRKALIDHVADEDKIDGVTIRDSIGRNQKPKLINESGLYSLVLSSKLEQAQEIRHWITSEVMPSIARTGEYKLPNKNLKGDPEWLEARQFSKEIRKLETDVIKEFIEYARKQGSQRPEVAYYKFFSILANRALGLPDRNGRDYAPLFQQKAMAWTEDVLGRFLKTKMSAEKNYKQVLEDAQIWVEEFLRVNYIQPNLLT